MYIILVHNKYISIHKHRIENPNNVSLFTATSIGFLALNFILFNNNFTLLGSRIVDGEPYSNHRVCPSVSKLYSSHITFNFSSLVDLHLSIPRPIKISASANNYTCFFIRNARKKLKNEMYLKPYISDDYSIRNNHKISSLYNKSFLTL
jgi:hypothetical protein